jgi:hypothetical protein
MPRIEIERIEEVDERDQTSCESFDRVAFAERAIALVRPLHMTVAICEGSRRVRIDSGRQWGRGAGARWAVLSVPHDASRRAIARAVLDLSPFGVARPWALDILVGEWDSAYRGPIPRDTETADSAKGEDG